MFKGRLEFLIRSSINLGTFLEKVEERIKALGEDSNAEKELDAKEKEICAEIERSVA